VAMVYIVRASDKATPSVSLLTDAGEDIVLHGTRGDERDGELLAMLTGARPFSGPSLPFCLPAIAARLIVLSIGAESSG
jgi:hypothetical protein